MIQCMARFPCRDRREAFHGPVPHNRVRGWLTLTVEGARPMGGSTVPNRVLVVDDDPELIALLRDGLELEGGYQVEVAPDGAVGLERCLASTPACVVADVRMSGLNEYQFVRALRGDPATAGVPVIVLSARVQERERLAGLLAGADTYLSKPITIATLLTSIQDIASLTAPQLGERRRTLIGEASIEVRMP